MKTVCSLGAMVLLGLGCMTCGCRAHPASYGMMILGDAISGADVDERKKELLGKPPAAADAMFGERSDTFVDMDNTSSQTLWYPVDADLLTVDRWVVEVSEGQIIVLTRTRENSDGVEDVIRSADLRSKIIGKTPVECRRKAGLKEPVARFRCVETGDRVLVHDVANFTNLRGARYCLLWFDSSGTCTDIKLVGVSASTIKEPLGSNPP